MATKVDNFNETTELCIVFYPSVLYTKDFFSSTNKYKQQSKKHKYPTSANTFRATLFANHIRLTHNDLQNNHSSLSKTIHIAMQNVWFCPTKPYVSHAKTLPKLQRGLCPQQKDISQHIPLPHPKDTLRCPNTNSHANNNPIEEEKSSQKEKIAGINRTFASQNRRRDKEKR